MTVIAWDGRTIAADSLANDAGLKRVVNKLLRVNDGVIAVTGAMDQGLELQAWFEAGADPAKWPEFQKKDDWTRLIRATREGCWWYARTPYPQRVIAPFTAFGSGRDFAIAAMHMGKSAKEGVELACELTTECMGPVDVIELR